MERLQNQKEKLYEDQRVQEMIKQRREELQSNWFKTRKQMIFDKIWKSKYSHQKPKQKSIQSFFAPEVPMNQNLQKIQEVQMEEEIKEEVGNRYARVDQRYKLTRKKDRKHCWYYCSTSHLKAKCPDDFFITSWDV